MILSVIIMNCFTMVWVSPRDPPNTAKFAFVTACEWAFLVVYTIEFLLKMVAYGLLFTQGAYLRQAWGQIDLMIVALGW